MVYLLTSKRVLFQYIYIHIYKKSGAHLESVGLGPPTCSACAMLTCFSKGEDQRCKGFVHKAI